MSERVAALSDPVRKARILEEPTGHGFMRLFRLMDEGRKIWLMTDPPNYEPDPKDSLHAQATSRGLIPGPMSTTCCCKIREDRALHAVCQLR